jgi:biotin carboxyl carrier protein
MNERIDTDQVREIIRLAEEADLAELEVEVPSLKVKVRRHVPAPLPASGQTAWREVAETGRDAATPPAVVAATGAAETGLNHLEPVVAPSTRDRLSASSRR